MINPNEFRCIPEKDIQNDNIIIINGDEELSAIFRLPTNDNSKLMTNLLHILEKNKIWNEYFLDGGISKYPTKFGIRVKSNITYPYSSKMRINTGHSTEKPISIGLSEAINAFNSYGSSMPKNQKVIWISYRDPDIPINNL